MAGTVYQFGEEGTIKATASSLGRPVNLPPLHYYSEDEALANANPLALVATMENGAVVGITVDPTWTPPAPPVPDTSVQDGLAELAQVVAKNVAASPHDRRFLTQKDIGKQAIAWIKGHPACTAQEAEDYIMALVLAELPGQPVVPKLYWEWQGQPQGLAMSYLREAIDRGYTAPFVAAGVLPDPVPMTWESLVALIVATPEEQIAAWLRSL